MTTLSGKMYLVELTVHSERMGRHARGVAESLQQVKNTVQSIGEELSKKVSTYVLTINTF